MAGFLMKGGHAFYDCRIAMVYPAGRMLAPGNFIHRHTPHRLAYPAAVQDHRIHYRGRVQICVVPAHVAIPADGQVGFITRSFFLKSCCMPTSLVNFGSIILWLTDTRQQ